MGEVEVTSYLPMSILPSLMVIEFLVMYQYIAIQNKVTNCHPLLQMDMDM